MLERRNQSRGGYALASPVSAATASVVRVDQAGFLPGETKQAYLMTGRAVSGAQFAVVDGTGATVPTGNVGSAGLGGWNSTYRMSNRSRSAG